MSATTATSTWTSSLSSSSARTCSRTVPRGTDSFRLSRSRWSNQFPSNLVLTSEILESFSNIFQFLFSLRCQKHHLRSIFFEIKRLKRANFPHSIVLKFSLLRSFLETYVNATLEYLFVDLLQPLWSSFYSRFLKMSDFDDLRKSVSSLLKNIFEGLFWDYAQIGFCFRRLNRTIADLTQLLRASTELPPNQISAALGQLYEKVYKNYGELVTALFIIIDIGKAEFASKLFLKLNFNDHFKEYIKEKAD